MPVPSFNTAAGALAVIFADTKDTDNQTFFQEIEDSFDPTGYVKYDDVRVSGDDVFNDIQSRVMEKNISLPMDRRIVFCNIMNLGDVDDTWENVYLKRMKEIARKANAQSAAQHYYLNVFKYSTADSNADMADRIADIFENINKSVNFKQYHSEFLMYAGGFDTFDQPMLGLASLVKRLCCTGWNDNDFYMPEKLQGKLLTLAYDRYSEHQAEECQNKLEEMKRWETECQVDKELFQLNQVIASFGKRLIEKFNKDKKFYEKNAGLYPVPVDDFERNGILWWEKYIPKDTCKRRMEKQVAAHLEDFFNRADIEDEIKALGEDLDTYDTYRDISAMYEAVTDKSIEKRVDVSLNGLTGNMDKKIRDSLKKRMTEIIRETLEERYRGLPEIKKKKDAERQKLLIMSRQASRYENLDACIRNIGNISYQRPVVLSPVDKFEILLLNNQKNQIESMLTDKMRKRAWFSSDMGGTDIEYFKIASLIDFDPDQNRERDFHTSFKQMLS